MKIVLTCGHPHSGHALVHGALVAAGLVEARPSRRESLSPTQWHESVCKAHGLNPLAATKPLNPGKVWQELAVDVFLGNLDETDWGWTDARTVWLLDFWKDFDPQIYFVLAYSTPERVAGQMLLDPSCDIDAAIASWTAYNNEILRFYHRNPERCLLVNASAVERDPGQFVEQAKAAFGLGIPSLPADCQLEKKGAHAIAATLIKLLIGGRSEPAALYREMESSTDLAAVPEEGIQQAWKEYARLISEHEQAKAAWQAESKKQATAYEAAQREWKAQLEQASKASEEQTKLAAARQSALEAKAAEAAQLQSSKAALAQENELLLLQLHQAQEELEGQMLKAQAQEGQSKLAAERQQQIEQISRERDGQTKLAAERQQRIDQLSRERDDQARLAAERQQRIDQLSRERDDQARLAAERQRALDAKNAEIAGLQSQKGTDPKLAQENELLLLQLHQVQEELERVFMQQQSAPAAQARTAALPVFGSQAVELLFDLRQDFDGENWYQAEHDGRWAGPNEASTFRMAALHGGEYELQLDVVDAMEPDILFGMEVLFNGAPVTVEAGWEGYPALVQGRFRADSGESVWEFRFKFPRLVSPSERGSDDHRRLAVRMRSLRLKAIS